MTAYYNEIDPFAAEWLRELIKAGHIAPGVVDTRSIEDVEPADLLGFTQCHFFAGIGVWSYALRQAGWPDSRSVWTGSCPCQPFSAAGKRTGTADERHLWPAWFHLIESCRPEVVFGEQVEAAIKHGWLDLVQADLEGSGYACTPVCLPAAGVGAPHIRSRLYFVADTEHAERWPINQHREHGCNGAHGGRQEAHGVARTCGEVRDVATKRPGWRGRRASEAGSESGEVERPERLCATGLSRVSRGELGHAEINRREGPSLRADRDAPNGTAETGLTNGFWRDAQWLWCRDGKYRPVESGTFPLAHGASQRVGRLRGYGNAIVAPVAQAFIEAYLNATS